MIIEQILKEVKITGAWSYPKFTDIWIVAILHFFYQLLYRLYFTLKWKIYYKNGMTDKPISDKD